MDVGGQSHAPTALLPGKCPRYALNRRLGGPHNQSGRFGEEINFLPLSKSEPRTVQHVTWSLYQLRYLASTNINMYKLNPCSITHHETKMYWRVRTRCPGHIGGENKCNTT
jgi:hypothetical protein